MNPKIYKDNKISNTNMLPGDLKGSPDESFSKDTLVFIDSAFLSKLSKQSNHLIKSVYKYKLLTKEDFTNFPLGGSE
jgi:hypothetical protein